MSDMVQQESSWHSNVERVNQVERVLSNLICSKLRRDHNSVISQFVDCLRHTFAFRSQHQNEIVFFIKSQLVYWYHWLRFKSFSLILLSIYSNCALWCRGTVFFFFFLRLVAVFARGYISRDDLELIDTLLSFDHKLLDKLDWVERNELQSSRTHFANSWRETTRIFLVYQYPIYSDEHSSPENAPKVLRICDLIQEQVKLALLLLSQWLNICYLLDPYVFKLRSLKDNVLVRFPLGESLKFHLSALNVCVSLPYEDTWLWCPSSMPSLLSAQSLDLTSSLPLSLW